MGFGNSIHSYSEANPEKLPMRVKLQLILCYDGHEDTITDVITLKKDHRRLEHLGLTLQEAKQLLNTIQKRLLQPKWTHFWTGARPAAQGCGVEPHGNDFPDSTRSAPVRDREGGSICLETGVGFL
jgi:hypothetical protein